MKLCQRYSDGARQLGKPFPHAKILGPSGAGKSTLITCIAKSYGTRAFILYGGPQLTEVAMAEALRGIAPNDFIGVDEAHSTRHPIQELLYQVIDRGVIPTVDTFADNKRSRLTGYRHVGPLTVVLATNQPGQLLEPLVNRTGLEIALDPYSVNSLIEIGRQHASELKILLTAHAHRTAATYANGIPRRLRLLLEHLAIYHPGSSKIGVQLETSDVRELLESFGIDSVGLSVFERKYLGVMLTLSNDEANLRTLVTAVGLDERQVKNRLEHRLLTEGWISIQGNGRRVLTDAGRAIIKASQAAQPKEDL